jgi:hypothetical protein
MGLNNTIGKDGFEHYYNWKRWGLNATTIGKDGV